MSSKIVGSKFAPGADAAIARLDSAHPLDEAELVLKRNPRNEYDTNAVEVWTQAPRRVLMLGHVPREDAKAVARVMDRNLPVRCFYRRKGKILLTWIAATQEELDQAFENALK